MERDGVHVPTRSPTILYASLGARVCTFKEAAGQEGRQRCGKSGGAGGGGGGGGVSERGGGQRGSTARGAGGGRDSEEGCRGRRSVPREFFGGSLCD